MVTADDIEKLAALARVALSDEEKKTFVTDIDTILAYVGKIQSLSQNVAQSDAGLMNVFREDANPHESGIFSKEILAAAPGKEGGAFKVKRILPAQNF